MASGSNFDEESTEIEGLRDEALLYVDQALALEETNHTREAVVMYEKALTKLDIALKAYQELGDNPSTKKRRLKLTKIRQQILFRLQEHKVPVGLQTRSQRDFDSFVAIDSDLPSDADILFSIPTEVQIFYIGLNGEVSCPSYPSALHIFRFKDASPDQPAFLKVGSWVYPLVPGQSPVLKSHLGKYLFPDLDESIEGNAIGLIFPDNLPADEIEVFDVILEQLTAAVRSNDVAVNHQSNDLQAYDEYSEFSTRLSSGMVQGADYIGLGLIAASVKASEWMYRGTELLKEKIEPDTESTPIDPRLKTGLQVAKWTADKAAKGSGYLVSKAGTATLALGRFLAPHLRHYGASALTHVAEQSETKSQKQIEIASEVAGGTVKAFSSIYMSLENSSKILAKNIANNTVTIVTHKYGGDVGTATENALSTVGNTYLTVYNTAALGPKGLAKRVVKNTGKVLVNADPNVPEQQTDFEPEPALRAIEKK